jgi:hypothetical protein
LPWFVLLLAALACNFSLNQQNIDATEEPGMILFQDDFSDPSSGWVRAVTPSGSSDYNDGTYRIFVNDAFTDIWSVPGLTAADVRIEVDALKVGGERDNRFGVICRAAGENFYTFMISSDGYYGIGKSIGMRQTLIGNSAMQPSPAINQGTALNHLRAECIGDTLTLTINGQMVAQVRDSEFISGDVGLIAGTYETLGVDILFANFVVSEP